MPKEKVAFICQECGYSSPRWLGKCPECASWNTFVETLVEQKQAAVKEFATRRRSDLAALPLTALGTSPLVRIPTGYSELDRVTGGGIVPGSVLLLGGEPGIGKSTLLLQLVDTLQVPSLYVSAEESPEQLRLRAERLGIAGVRASFLATTVVEDVLAVAAREQPGVIIIDSIQTVYSEELAGIPGSIGQVRASASALIRHAKEHQIAIILVGHITKEGTIAGPKVLEHLVDAVFYFEGEQYQEFRVVRAVKNRYGAVNELGIFTMHDQGLVEVANPSALFLSQEYTPGAGSVIVATMEGTRPVLVEIQALVSKTVFGYPKRTASGIDPNRLQVLVAVLAKKGGIFLENQDIYLNVTGGLRVREPALDLGLVLALSSGYRGRPLPERCVVFGEVGLSGEVRSVRNIPRRLQEIARLGYRKAIVPQSDEIKEEQGLHVQQVHHIEEALGMTR